MQRKVFEETGQQPLEMIVHETKNKEENFRRKKKAKNNFFKENDSFSQDTLREFKSQDDREEKTSEVEQKIQGLKQNSEHDKKQQMEIVYISNRRNNRRKEEEVQKKQEYQIFEKRKKQIIKVFMCLFIALILSGIIVAVMLIIFKHNQEQYDNDQANIIDRKFTENHCYKLQYIVTTDMNETQVDINYTAFFVVRRTSQTMIDFVCLLQKRSETTISQNSTQIQYYDQSNAYQTILKEGGQGLPSQNSTNQTLDFDEYMENYSFPNLTLGNSSEEELQFTTPYIPTFRFSLLSNGKIANFVFPTEFDKRVLGLLRGFVKLFSPLLDKDLYIEKKVKSKRKVGNTSTYEEEENYDYQTSSEQTILKNEGSVGYSGETHNTNQTMSQSSAFTNDGELKESNISSSTDFNSVPQEKNENYDTYSSDLAFNSQQYVNLKVLESFLTEEHYVEEFQGFIKKYEDSNDTYTMTVEELINYVIGGEQQQDIGEPGQIRLLLEADGSLSLLKYEKQLTIMKTNLIGIQIGAYGYLKTNLNLYEQKKNKNKKEPIFKIDAGTILQLGSKKFKKSLSSYEKKFPPLTLKFTLEQIEGVVELLKSDFISEIIEISKLLLDGDFDDNLVPNILKVVDLVDNLNQAIDSERQANSPVAILRNIFATVADIEAIINTKGLDLLNPQNQFAKNLTTGLLSFVNVSYEEALNVFETMKSSLSLFEEEGSDFLLDMLLNYTDVKLVDIVEEIKNLVPANVLEAYDKQIEKAKDILDFIDYVKDLGLDYKNILQEIEKSHKQHFLNYTKNLIDLYFDNQTFITDSFLYNITDRIGSIFDNVQVFQHKLDFIQTMDAKVISYFQTLFHENLHSDYYLTNFTNLLNNAQTYSRSMPSEQAVCCNYKRKWTGKKYCAHWNPVFGSFQSEKSYFNALRAEIQSLFNENSKSVRNFQISLSEILGNNSLNMVQKYEQIQVKFSQILVMNQQSIIEKVKARLDAVNSVRSRVACGSVGNINAYIVSLNSLHTMVTDFKNQYDQIAEAYVNITSDFKSQIYNKIVDNSKISEGVRQFVESYNEKENQTKQIINELDEIVSGFDPQNFVKSFDMINHLFKLYGDVGDSLQQLCLMNSTQHQAIQNIRSGYQEQLQALQNISDEYLGGEIQDMIKFLNQSGESILQVYKFIPFCELTSLFRIQIQTIFPELENFTVILDMYNKFTTTWKRTNAQLSDLQDQMLSLRDRFFDLFKVQDYKNFLNNTFSIAQNLTDIVYNVSMEMSNLKEEAKSLYIFNTGSESQLTTVLLMFTSAPFQLSSVQMFVNVEELSNLALSIVELMSYDILAVVVASKRVYDYSQLTIDTFTNGTHKIQEQFSQLCSSFINLDALVTQEYLNDINTNFRNLINTLNQTLFPSIKENVEEIKIQFSDFEFKSKQMKDIYDNSMEVFQEFANITQETKQTVFEKMNDLNQKIVKLINALEIGSLNSIFQLAKVVEDEFTHFFKSFPSLIKQILTFENLVGSDFNNLFSFKNFLKTIEDKVEEKYQQSIENILTKINSTQNDLSTNSDFYNKFKNSSIYSSLDESSDTFFINFEEFWQSVDEKIIQFDDFISQITGDVEQLLKQLSDAKNKMSDIKSSVNQRIKNIKDEFKVVKRKLFNIKSLIFSILRADLGQTVMISLKKIINQTDNIVEIDLAKVNDIVNGTFVNNINYIKVLLDKAFEGYGQLKQIRDKFVDKIENGTKKIDKFLHENIAIKFQKLKDGLLYIKSQTNLQSPTQSIVLYERELYKKRVPIFSYQQIIPTAIGTFLIAIQIQYTLGAKIQIALRQFRSVDIKLIFDAALVIDLRFGYGICYILEFGLFVRGRILSAQIELAVRMNHIIPTQLVQAVMDVPQLTKNNVVTVDFTVDLALNAFQITVGFYIKYIWLQIIWIHLRICLNFWFFTFCITIPIPIGFKITFKRHDFGYIINGIPIFKKRILTLPLLEFQY